MALQIVVTKVSVKDAGPAFNGELLNVTMNLKCWTDGDNPETDPAVLDSNFSGKYKVVAELAIQQRIDRTVAEIQGQMQAAIDDYKRELILLSHALLNAAVTTIQTNLVG